MPSTRSESIALAGPAHLPAVGRSKTTVSTAFEILDGLLSRARYPLSVADEQRALALVRRLHEQEALDADEQQKRDALICEVGRLTVEDIRATLGWLGEARAPWWVLPGLERRRAPRLLLLFVMLAHVVAPYLRFPILRVLADQGLTGGHEELDALMRWLPRRPMTRVERDLCLDYLDLCRRVLFDHVEQNAPRTDVTVEQFGGWPWPRQLLWLASQRESWRLSEGARSGAAWITPIVHARRPEFALARSGAYRRLARRGGPIARAVLQQLRYRDLSARRTPWALRSLVLATLLGLASVAVGAWAVARVHRWNELNRSVATAVIHRFGDTLAGTPTGR